MSQYLSLPQVSHKLFLTDGGLETTLIDREGLELPDFAAFPLLETAEGRDALARYFTAYMAVAHRHGTGLVLETPTWRASADWGRRLGYDAAALRAINTAAVDQLRALRAEHADATLPIVISGNLGPRSDDASPVSAMSADESQRYHRVQVRTLRDAGADLVTALTIAHVDEAIGIVRAAVELDIAVVISFTVDEHGSLPSGPSLEEAITELDAATGAAAAYLMINCAHPTLIMGALDSDSGAFARVRGVRANASAGDEAGSTGTDSPAELAERYVTLAARLPTLTIMGGCCGTDDRHIEAIAAACVAR